MEGGREGRREVSAKERTEVYMYFQLYHYIRTCMYVTNLFKT